MINVGLSSEKTFTVWVAKEDINFLRFLWWPNGDITKELVEHRMKSSVPATAQVSGNFFGGGHVCVFDF